MQNSEDSPSLSADASPSQRPTVEALAGKRVTVMGLGQFGGGLGAVRFLLSRGARVTLTDLKSAEQLADSLGKLDVSRLETLVLGEHREQDFSHADLIVVNPAVKRAGNRYLEIAQQHNVPLTSEIALLWQLCPAKKIVVTGSAGKSTTATLVHHCLQAANLSASLGGNIGGSLLSEVDRLTPQDWVVLELSSFQLADLEPLHPQPEIAVVTNFFPNHLDWHESLDEYRAAKQVAIGFQTTDQFAVLNGDDADSALWPTDAHVIWFGREIWQDRPGVHIADGRMTVRSAVGGWIIEPDDLAPCLRAPHMLSNVAAALAVVVVGLRIPVDRIAAALSQYVGLPHRLETVAQLRGRTFINDSKATTPEALSAALDSISAPIVLIAGGKDKGVALQAAARKIVGRAKAVALIGETASHIDQEIETLDPARSVSRRCCDSLKAALHWAWEHSESGDVILLSPGCASQGEFSNYEQRGECFARLAREYA